MITHTVLFKFAGPYREHLPTARDALAGLIGKVPYIRSLSVGTNVLPSQRAYDLCLIATFESLADLAAYRAHPEHLAVAEDVDQYCQSVVSCDYEV